MGWKSTRTLTRKEAIGAILQAQNRRPYEEMTNKELEEVLDQMGFGESLDLPFFGYNFIVVDTDKEQENFELN